MGSCRGITFHRYFSFTRATSRIYNVKKPAKGTRKRSLFPIIEFFGPSDIAPGDSFRHGRGTPERRTGRWSFNDASRFAAVDISSSAMTSRWRIDDLLHEIRTERRRFSIPRPSGAGRRGSLMDRAFYRGDLEPSTGVGVDRARIDFHFSAGREIIGLHRRASLNR